MVGENLDDHVALVRPGLDGAELDLPPQRLGHLEEEVEAIADAGAPAAGRDERDVEVVGEDGDDAVVEVRLGRFDVVADRLFEVVGDAADDLAYKVGQDSSSTVSVLLVPL